MTCGARRLAPHVPLEWVSRIFSSIILFFGIYYVFVGQIVISRDRGIFYFPCKRRQFRMRLTLTKRIVFSVIALVLLGGLSMFVLYRGLLTAREALTEVTQVTEPMSAAAYEMEINIIGTGLGVLKYLDAGDAQYLRRVEDGTADFARFKAQYDALARTPEAKVLGAQLDELFHDFRSTGVTLIQYKDMQDLLNLEIAENFVTISNIFDNKINVGIEASGKGSSTTLIAVAMKAELAEIGLLLSNYFLLPQSRHRERIIATARQFHQQIQTLKSSSMKSAERAVVTRIEQLWARTEEIITTTLSLKEQSLVGIQRFFRLRKQMDDILDEKIQVNTLAGLIASENRADASYRSVLHQATVLAALSISVLLVAAWIVWRSVQRPIVQLMEGAEQVGQGNLTFRLTPRGDDELARLGHSFNAMATELEAITVSKSKLEISDAKLRDSNIDLRREIHERLQAEKKLAYHATHDVLTQLPNRGLLHDRVRQAILTARRENTHCALMLFDLNRFKDINDTLGHHSGDLLLQGVGSRILKVLRNVDTVARLGGDEFAVVLPGADRENAALIAHKILGALKMPFSIEGLAIEVTASVGIAIFPEHGEDIEVLLRRADIAMYAAKHSAIGCAFYSVEIDPHSRDRLLRMTELRGVIERDELTVYYQPKIRLRDKALIGMEALVRWQHPEHGLILPEGFVPLAEQTGLIKPLTIAVMKAALAQCRDWHASHVPITVAVNLSVQGLWDPIFLNQLAQLINASHLDPSSLELEVTESVLMAQAERAREMLAPLHEMGVRFSIDDFGTGYSSLSYLKKLPVDTLKIDRTFVSGLTEDSDDAVIVGSVIGLAHSLGLEVVAEGVENRASWDCLRNLGCDVVQGYYVSEPMTGADSLRAISESKGNREYSFSKAAQQA